MLRRMRGRNVFYGWVIVVGLALVSFVIGGMGGLNAGLFVKPMEEDIGFAPDGIDDAAPTPGRPPVFFTTRTGSYAEAWTFATVLLAVVAVIILFTP